MDKLSYYHAPIRRRRRRMLAAMLLASSLATVGAGAMSLAVFTDSQASTGAWAAGSIVLGVNPTTAFKVNGILPGDSGTQIIGVTNSGTAQLRYSLGSAVSDADGKHLAANMNLVITTGSVASGACTGTVVYSGTLDHAGFGSAATGADPGDRDLDAGATENLCFGWSLPLAAGDGLQTAATNATFTFASEQTAHNP